MQYYIKTNLLISDLISSWHRISWWHS